MNIRRLTQTMLLLACSSLATMAASTKADAPKPILPLPEQKQIDWQKMETYAFIHFGLNTFNDREWGYGDSDPMTFNPTKPDCEQWARTLVAAGMKGVILTAKHHDGFCLWPFAGNDYNVSKSPFRGGKGNVVRELSEACKKYGLKFAVYLSPWDRSRADYATPGYLPYLYAQLRDLLTNYGEVFEVWFDGANGGDGYYGGAKDTRTIDRKNYYNYPRIFEMLDSLQPQAVVFGDGGPGCRWVGNEKGFAGETNWAFLRKGEVYPGYPQYHELQYGHADGNQWTAAECDVSIRPGWFYHPEEDDKVKSPEQLVDLYYRSVGHNATLLLNFPVDRDGLIHHTDSANAVTFHRMIQQELGTNLVAGMKAKVSSQRGKGFSAKALTDGNWDTYWATPDGVNTGTMEFTFKKAQPMNRIMLQEYIALGQRVKKFAVEYLDDKGVWTPVRQSEETTTIGYKRLLRFKTVTSKGIRVRITDARGPLCINNVGVFYGGENAQLTWSETAEKIINSLEFNVLEKGTDGKYSKWDDERLGNITDRDVATTAFANADEIIIDFGKEVNVSRLQYLPQQSDNRKGLVANYTITACDAEGNDIQTIKTGEFSNIQNNPVLQTVELGNVKTQYLKFKAERTTTPGENMGIAELSIH